MTRHLELSLSKDGHTPGDFKARPVPDWGDYSDPMPCWRRNGTARRFDAYFRFTEAAQISFLALEIEAG